MFNLAVIYTLHIGSATIALNTGTHSARSISDKAPRAERAASSRDVDGAWDSKACTIGML